MIKGGFIRRCAILVFIMVTLVTITSRPTKAGVLEQSVFMPIIVKPSTVQISGFILTQAVQDEQNGVPLVANRPTLLRIFTTTDGEQDQANVSITVTASRNGAEIGSRLIGPQTASGNSTREDLNSTFNLVLPPNWLTGTVILEASVGGDAGVQITAAFQTVPDLNLRIVPIRYTHQPNGQTYTTPNVDTISDWIMRTYPLANINVTFHAQYPFMGDLSTGTGWNQLLPQMRTLKLSTGGATVDQVFYGLIPADWFNGGIAGYGYIGFRAAIGLDLSGGWWGADTAGELAAHEIGHNFGRYHVDCGGASGIDPQYPYDPATIGQFGIDGIADAALDLIPPAGAKDFMGYCDPVWVSDYTYEALLNDQMAYGAAVSTEVQERLLITGLVGADGLVNLEPAYILPLSADLHQSSTYMIDLLDDSGTLLGTYPARILRAHETDVSGNWIYANLPLPDEPAATVRVRDIVEGSIVAVKTLWVPSSPAALAMQPSLLRQGDAAVLQWAPADQPALVRHSADGGQTWQALGLDVLGGSFSVELNQLPGGAQNLFEIIPANSSISNRVQIPLAEPLQNKAPQLWISGPTHITSGEHAILYGFGTDVEDGAMSQLLWGMNGERLEVDNWLSLEDLPPGSHQITLQGTDSQGETAVVTHELTVTAAEPGR